MSEISYRWLDGPAATQEEWDQIDKLLASRGWMSINRLTSRVLLAEQDGDVVGFHVFQMIPYCGPLFVTKKLRGLGLAEILVDKMQDFLITVHARGYIAVTESPHAAKLCEERGMEKVPYPLYVMANPGGVEV